MQKNGLIWKIFKIKKLIFKIYDVTNCNQTISMHILPNTSQSKDNQAKKCFSLKIMQKQAERLVLDLFFVLFSEKALLYRRICNPARIFS